MPGRSVAAVAAFVVALAAPAVAHATTFTVDPSAPLGCDATNHCRTISAANAAARAGDTIAIQPGTYEEPGRITVTAPNLTFSATPGTVTVHNADGTAGEAVFLLGDATKLSGLIVAVGANGGEAVIANGAGATISSSTLERAGATPSAAPVLGAGPGASGVIAIDHSILLQLPSAAPSGGAPPALQGNAATSLQVSDSTIFSGKTTGPAVTITGTGNGADGNPAKSTFTRDLIYGLNGAAPVFSVTSATGSPAKTIGIDTSIIGGAGSAGIAASTDAGSSGAITLTGTHVTIAGSRKPVSASVAASLLTAPGGAVSLSFDRSIVHGATASTVTAQSGGLPSSAGSATLAISKSDVTDANGGNIAITQSQTNPDVALFVSPAKLNYHLREDSPAIGKGGPPVAGESTTDIDGQPRGDVTDLGADEFVNATPTARFTSSASSVRQNQPVTFDATGSTDPEAGTGGGIVHYLWNFGDGTTDATSGPVVSHTYAQQGTYTVTLVVVDPLNAADATQSTVTVTDGIPPTISITDPKRGQHLHITIHKTVKRKVKGADGKTHTVKQRIAVRRAFRFGGIASDDSGIATVELSLRRVSLSKTTTSSTKKKNTVSLKGSGARGRAAAKAQACTYLDGKTSFVTRNCKNPLFFAVTQDNGLYTYKLKKGLKLKPGLYELSARATDKSGVTSAPVSVRFRLL